jgi:dihydroorotate dehydrogenase (NAD+) catalytic subunit
LGWGGDFLLSVTVAGIKMKTPVMTASGTFGFGMEYSDFVDLNQIGAVVVKGTTLAPRSGNSGRRIAETPSGMLNSIGLENPGVEAFLTTILPKLTNYDVPVIVNIAGNTVEEYGELAKQLTVPGIAALEVNISCPNVKQGGIAFGTNCDSAASVISMVKAHTNLPVIAKLSPNVTDIIAMAQAVEYAGADAISLINTLLGMAIDVRSWRPVLGNVVGGLSGPAVKPVAVRMVWQVAQVVKVPVIGMGGIMTAEDAIEFLLAGASAVAVGTANFVNPQAVQTIAAGIQDYLLERGLSNVSQLVGKVTIA